MSQMIGRDSDWKSRRVLVTGAGGFVGRWLVEELAVHCAHVQALFSAGSRGNEDIARHLSAAGADIVRGDVTDLDFIRHSIAEAKIDTVYHLAAININVGSMVTPYEIFETNLRGTYAVLEACRLAPTRPRAIIASSKEVEACFSEAVQRKRHPYMASKAGAELIARTYSETFGVPVTLVRCDNVYGGGDFNWARLVPGTVRAALHGETPVIRSDGKLQRDYVHVKDAVSAYLAVGERIEDSAVQGQLFRVATGVRTSTLDVVTQVGRAVGRSEFHPRILNEESDERIDAPYMPEFEHEVLGWESRITLEQGLARTVEWYRDFFEDKGQARTV